DGESGGRGQRHPGARAQGSGGRGQSSNQRQRQQRGEEALPFAMPGKEDRDGERDDGGRGAQRPMRGAQLRQHRRGRAAQGRGGRRRQPAAGERRKHQLSFAEGVHAAGTIARVGQEGFAIRISRRQGRGAGGVRAQLVAGGHSSPFSRCRSVSYPRNARSFTAPALVPSAPAISGNVIPSYRWRWITVRCDSGSASRAARTASRTSVSSGGSSMPGSSAFAMASSSASSGSRSRRRSSSTRTRAATANSQGASRRP